MIVTLARNKLGAYGILLSYNLDLSYNYLTTSTIPGEDIWSDSQGRNLQNSFCEIWWTLAFSYRYILADSSQEIWHYPSALMIATPSINTKVIQHCCSLDIFIFLIAQYIYANLLIVSMVVGICLHTLWKVLYNYRFNRLFVGSRY